MTEIIIQILPESDADTFAQAYAIYSDAILRTEQRPEAELWKLRLRPDYRFLVARRGAAIAGMSVAYVPSEDYFWLFEYASVAPWARGAGVGGTPTPAATGAGGTATPARVPLERC